MDAEAMVTRARHWINVPPQMQDNVTNITLQQIPGVTYAESLTYNGPIRYLEHVVVRISVTVPTNVLDVGRGDLFINVTSPSGTHSIMLGPRFKDKEPGGYVDWPFMSVMFWGENPTGQWTLHIRTIRFPGIAIVTKVEFEFYGVSEVPEEVANIPDQCHSDCSRGCAREGSNFCDSCVNLRNSHTLECIDQCPSGYTERSGYCYNTTLPLKECNSPLKNKEGTDFTQTTSLLHVLRMGTPNVVLLMLFVVQPCFIHISASVILIVMNLKTAVGILLTLDAQRQMLQRHFLTLILELHLVLTHNLLVPWDIHQKFPWPFLSFSSYKPHFMYFTMVSSDLKLHFKRRFEWWLHFLAQMNLQVV
ncbi:Proprotein convertase subtilisin/kexin type 5 [Geodia barretti]|uniref:Proprotein convertase subtilisin/kexin type 5 n=1 Tax=Geodia barretti TaxID=519541 RepID=A0AA35RC01_GEOBA|nr:Proprotein convertase subtilisin/kexin type 5 [Geodia barretti]